MPASGTLQIFTATARATGRLDFLRGFATAARNTRSSKLPKGDVNGQNTEVDDYWVSLMSDQEETLYVFKLDQVENNLVLQNNYVSTTRENYYTSETSGDGLYSSDDTFRWIRLLGYGYKETTNEHVAYWGDLTYVSDNDKYFGTPHVNYVTSLFYLEECLNTGVITKHLNPPVDSGSLYVGVFLVSAYWHPINKEVHIIYTNGAYMSDSHYAEEVEDGVTESYAIYDYGSFFVGDNEYSRGFRRFDYTATYVAGELTSFVTVGTTINAYYYELEKIIFNLDLDLDSISYEYHQNEIVPAYHCGDFGTTAGTVIFTGACNSYLDIDDCYLSDGTTLCRKGSCNCIEYVWTYHQEGDLEVINTASDTFPYDEGWTSIMFNGVDGNNVEYNNWVIYKDLEGDEGYFAISDTGTKYPIGTYDRAFFYNFTTTEEVE